VIAGTGLSEKTTQRTEWIPGKPGRSAGVNIEQVFALLTRAS
jgi:hypothetical protein